MAHAAWTRPAINLSSWSCMGPRRRPTNSHLNSTEEGSSPRSPASANVESSEPLLSSPKKSMNVTSVVQNKDLPVSSTAGEWSCEIECSCDNDLSTDAEGNVDLNDSDDIMDNEGHEDKMNEVELWQQLEHELYDRTEGEEEADVIKEIREEEAAMADATVDETQSSPLEMKEAHRFFPAGKIMHIVTLHSDEARNENDGSPVSESSDNSQPDETKIGIFQTPRSLYSKLRLSQTMVSDHFMPVYRRQIERLIKELEEEQSNEDQRTREVV